MLGMLPALQKTSPQGRTNTHQPYYTKRHRYLRGSWRKLSMYQGETRKCPASTFALGYFDFQLYIWLEVLRACNSALWRRVLLHAVSVPGGRIPRNSLPHPANAQGQGRAVHFHLPLLCRSLSCHAAGRAQSYKRTLESTRPPRLNESSCARMAVVAAQGVEVPTRV